MNALVQKIDRMFAGMFRPLGFLVAFATRAAVGISFFFHGKAKLGDLENTARGFEQLGIPMANLQAPLVGGLELVGGAALVLGVLTRPFAAILSVIMVVGLVCAHSGQLGNALAFDGQQHFIDISALAYLLFLLWVLVYGPGRLSVDSLVFDTEAEQSGKAPKH